MASVLIRFSLKLPGIQDMHYILITFEDRSRQSYSPLRFKKIPYAQRGMLSLV